MIAALVLFACPAMADPAPVLEVELAREEEFGELERAFVRRRDEWQAAVAEARREGLRRSEHPEHPAGSFWQRFESAAAAGEGRAVLWMLEHLREAGGAISTRRERAGRILEQIASAGDADWVPQALVQLPRWQRDVGLARLEALLATHAAPERPWAARVGARVAEAALIQREDLARADELRREAVELVMESDGEAPPEVLETLARGVVQSLQVAEMRSYPLAYEGEGPPVIRISMGGPGPPKRLYRQWLEGLAEKGSHVARAWFLSNLDSDEDDEDRRRALDYLRSLDPARLSDPELGELMDEVGSLADVLGWTWTEGLLVELLDALPEQRRARHMVSLGRHLCMLASWGLEPELEDGALGPRERGLALLRDVLDTWPDGPAARAAEVALFRETRLVVGQKVPDFEAEDVDGEPFKLSDFEGRVTVLEFWGFW